MKKQQKDVKELVTANVAVETAAKKMRGRHRKNASTPSVVVVAPTAPKAKGRPRLSAEEKALREQKKGRLKKSKRIRKSQKKTQKSENPKWSKLFQVC